MADVTLVREMMLRRILTARVSLETSLATYCTFPWIFSWRNGNWMFIRWPKATLD